MRHLKKAEGHINENVECIAMKMRSIVWIFWCVMFNVYYSPKAILMKPVFSMFLFFTWSVIAASFSSKHCPVSWGCRIHRLDLCKEVRPHKKSDGEVPVMLGVWGMLGLSLPLLPGPLWPRMVAPDVALSMG